MYFPNGKIIAFEGLDCSFKETNCKEFVSRLRGAFPNLQPMNNIGGTPIPACISRIQTESFPRYSKESSVFIRNWLNETKTGGDTYNRKMLKENPKIVSTFYALDRFDFWYNASQDIMIDPGTSFSYTNIDLLASGACFVFDRYTSSNAIYNTPIGCNNTFCPISKEDFTFDQDNFKVPNPDIVIWMRTGNFDVLMDLIAKKGNKDKNELDRDFLEEVWDKSESAINNSLYNRAGIKLIVINTLDSSNNVRSKEDIADEIWYKVMAALYDL